MFPHLREHFSQNKVMCFPGELEVVIEEIIVGEIVG